MPSREMRRVAPPGATVAATVWDARGGFVGNRIFSDTAAMLDPDVEKHRARYHTHPMTRPGELAWAWREAGFNDVREGYLTIRMEFENFADYWTPLTGKEGPLAAYVHSLAADTRAFQGCAPRRVLQRGGRRRAIVRRKRLGRARNRALTITHRKSARSWGRS